MAVPKRDYYEVLGVERTADADIVKRAYRKLAVKYHPDRNPDDPSAEQKFKEATEAYKVLSDAQQRQIYDQYGHAGLQNQGFQGVSSMDDIFDSFDMFSSVLGDLFGFGGGGRRSRRPMKGRNVRIRVPLSFEEAYTGVNKDLLLRDRRTCPDCSGSGAAAGGLRTCPDCGGAGQVVNRAGFITMSTSCGRCRGTGQVITRVCDTCEGGGAIAEKRTVSVDIPAGVDSGDSMGVPGQGEEGVNGGPRGDLILVFEVSPHEFLRRDRSDLHLDLGISFFQAALGDKVTVETMDGPATVKVEAGTQPGGEVRLRKKGLPDPNTGRRGDLIVHLQVEVPRKLSGSQKKLLQQMRESFQN